MGALMWITVVFITLSFFVRAASAVQTKPWLIRIHSELDLPDSDRH